MITAELFEHATGSAPHQDDLERSNCPLAGQIGHDYCGWSTLHNKPNFLMAFAEVRSERAMQAVILKAKS